MCLTVAKLRQLAKYFKNIDQALVFIFILEKTKNTPHFFKKKSSWKYSKNELLATFPWISFRTLTRILKYLADKKYVSRVQVRTTAINSPDSYYTPSQDFLMSVRDILPPASHQKHPYSLNGYSDCHGKDGRMATLLYSYSLTRIMSIVLKNSFANAHSQQNPEFFSKLNTEIKNLNKTSLSYLQKGIYNPFSSSKEYQGSLFDIKWNRDKIREPDKINEKPPKKSKIMKSKNSKNLKVVPNKNSWDKNHPFAEFLNIVSRLDTAFDLESWEEWLELKFPKFNISKEQLVDNATDWYFHHKDGKTKIKSFKSRLTTWIKNSKRYAKRDLDHEKQAKTRNVRPGELIPPSKDFGKIGEMPF